jgi:hypothetical protein
MEPSQFQFEVREDKRGTIFEGIEASRAADPEGAVNLVIRVARDHLVLSVWPVRPQAAGIGQDLAKLLGPPRQAPAVCGFGDCMDDDKDAPLETTLWEFDPAARPEVLQKVQAFLGLAPAG